MAKLSANDSTIVARWEKETNEDGVRKVQKYALRSDGVLLSSLVTWRPHSLFAGKMQRDNFGWNVARRFKRDRVQDAARLLDGRLREKGYEKVSK